MLILLLALVNGGQPSPAAEPAASPPTATRGLVASLGEAVTGAWAGEWAEAGAPAPIGLEAAFATGAATTVFGFFTFINNGARRTVLRHGVSAADGLRFGWPGGRRLELRLTASDRLEGDLVSLQGADAHAATGSVSLSRRPR